MLRLNSARFAVCLLPFILGACGDNSANDDPRTRPPLVRDASVELANNTSRTFTGVVVARTQSDLGFRVQGKILERFVDTGQTVKRGQPLMRLDPVDNRPLMPPGHAQEKQSVMRRAIVASLPLAPSPRQSTTRLKRRPILLKRSSAPPRLRQTWRKTRRAMPCCWPIPTAW